ncbi:MAG: PAS domain-containing sensor histidine kinase, partial [Alphaproteobacteria bacterium]
LEVRADDGRSFLAAGGPTPAVAPTRFVERPVMHEGRRIGDVRLAINDAFPTAAIADSRRDAVIGATAAALLAILLFVALLGLNRHSRRVASLNASHGRLEQEAAERRRAAAASAAAEARFRAFTEIASDWTWETDASHRFVNFSSNRGWTPMAEPHTYLGRTRWEIVGADVVSDAAWSGHYQDLEARREFVGFEYAFPKDGRTRHVRTSGRPIFGPNGSFEGYCGVGADVTSLREMEGELRQALDRAESANQAKAVFLANMSHDLRTPLNAIIGFAEVMRDETFGPVGSPRYLGYLDDMLASGRYLLALVNDILDVSLIESGGLNLDLQPADLCLTADEAVGRVTQTAAALDVALANLTPRDLPPALVDAKGMQQILTNLLDNALKFTPSGGSVHIAGEALDDGRVMLAVVDTGRGMTPEEALVATEPFATNPPDSPAQTFAASAGLGLAIVKGIVEAMGGALEIESRKGEGATVRVFLRRG